MSFLSKICAKYEIHATEDWPYFHVTDFTDTPNAPNLYLGIKGKKYSTSSYAWDRMKYFWSAQLKPNLKLYKPKEDWDLGEFDSAAKKIGFDASFMTTSNDPDVSFYQELIEGGKFEDLDDLIDQRPQYGFHILKSFASGAFFRYFSQEGYHGIYDEDGNYLYEAADITKEPQILIFNSNDIIWGTRVANIEFFKLIKSGV